MDVDITPILQSPRYAAEKKIVEVSGKQKKRVIYILTLLLFLIPIFWPLLFIYVLFKIPASLRQQKERYAAVEAFARQNGFTYQGVKGITRTSKIPKGPIFELPYEAEVMYSPNIMTGTLNGLPFTYTNTVITATALTADNNRKGSAGLNIFRITLPVNLPRLFADSKFNNMGPFDIKANNFREMEEHVLEGDFPTHYNVRAERNDRIDVLSVLSPDVMQALKDNYHYDLWINGNELQLIATGTEIEYFAAIPLVFKNIEVLLEEIDRIARAFSSRLT